MKRSSCAGRPQYLLSLLSLSISLALTGCNNDNDSTAPEQYTQPTLGYRSAAVIEKDGYQFKDLNQDNQLTPYEDWRLDSTARAEDLVSRMTLEQKIGLMMHGTLPEGDVYQADSSNRTVDFSILTPIVTERFVNTFITRRSGNLKRFVEENNEIQALAEKTALGIPVVISTDPRNHFVHDPGATAVADASFSQWPEALGFAALNDVDTIKEFANMARQEYRAVGIHETLSPQADLATDPRWGRSTGTFGENNDISKRMVGAYIEGFQNGKEGLNKDSVITVVKHWAGGGPQKDGLDPHTVFGKEQVYPGNNLDYHISPFLGAFDANVASVMPYYGIPMGLSVDGEKIEEVAFGFNKQMLDLLKGKYQFNGVVLSDWNILNDCEDLCITGIEKTEALTLAAQDRGKLLSRLQDTIGGPPWGVEKLTITQRIAKATNAGVDQFGGAEDPSYLIDAVNTGLVPAIRIDEAAKKILIDKFKLGLFEDPYVDADTAQAVAGKAEFRAAGIKAQSRAHVLLKNEGGILPLGNGNLKKVYLYGVQKSFKDTLASQYGLVVVDTPEQADVAILRLGEAYETDLRYLTGLVIHYGQSEYLPTNARGEPVKDGEVMNDINHPGGVYTGSAYYNEVKKVKAAGVPIIASVFMPRPVILTSVIDDIDGLLVNFGASDKALFDVLTGVIPPQGKLPFELPSNWQEVLDQKEDVPHDTANPLYQFGAGLSNYQS